jgi:hypothetical protein
LRAVGYADSIAPSRPPRLAYADPPYPGKAWLYYGGEVDLPELIVRLAAYDGWPLSTSAEALPAVLVLCQPGVRVAAWHGGPRPARSRWPLHAWEPVIYCGGRQLIDGTWRGDSIVCGVAPLDTLPGRVIGPKPAAVAVNAKIVAEADLSSSDCLADVTKPISVLSASESGHSKNVRLLHLMFGLR